MRSKDISFDHNQVLFKNQTDKCILNMFYDIGAAICNVQKLAESMKEDSTYDMSKVNTYENKTNIPQIIEEALKKSKYWEGYDWQYDKNFNSGGIRYHIIRFGINTSDWCIVERDDVQTKMSKKHIRQLWEKRDEDKKAT